MVYALSPTGTSRLVTSVTQSDVNAIAVQKNGDLVVGTGPQGALYSIPANGVPKLVADKLPGAVTGLAVSPTGDTWAIADSIIYRVRGQNIQLYSTESDEPYVALAVDGANNVVTATGTSAALYRLAANGAGTGHYDTPVRDAGRRALWGDVTWMGHTGIGDQLFIQTRSGDTSEPDPSWSGWSSAIGAPGTRIQSPAARYLQARVTLEKSSNSADGPVLHSLAITYLPENQRPSVQFAAPTVGSYVSKTVTVSWTGSDPDGDTLSYELYSSDDDGKTWQHVNTSAIKNNTGVKNSTAIVAKPAMPAIASTAAKPSSDAASQIAKLKAELDKHPELPAAVRAQILAHASSEIATQPVTPPSPEPPATGPISEPTFSWDTTHVPDGVYLLKVVASDKASNATGALDAEAISDRFTVANNVPEILTDPPAVNGGESIIKGVVRTSIADVASVQFKLDDGPLTAAEAVGGLFDSANAPFIAHLGTLTKGPHKIEFQVTDQSGNWSTKSVTFTE